MSETYTECFGYGQHIPWGQRRVLVEIRKGPNLVKAYELCFSCASGVEAKR